MNKMTSREVLSLVRKDRVRFVQLWFTDVLGFLKGVTIPVAQLGHAFDHGMPFDGSSIEGFARIEESDMVAKPDPSSFAVLPWEVQGERAGRVFFDILTPRGEPVTVDARAALKRVLARARRLGFTPYIGCEMESFYFKSDQSPEFL